MTKAENEEGRLVAEEQLQVEIFVIIITIFIFIIGIVIIMKTIMIIDLIGGVETGGGSKRAVGRGGHSSISLIPGSDLLSLQDQIYSTIPIHPKIRFVSNLKVVWIIKFHHDHPKHHFHCR